MKVRQHPRTEPGWRHDAVAHRTWAVCRRTEFFEEAPPLPTGKEWTEANGIISNKISILDKLTTNGDTYYQGRLHH
ncbi:hypothetical protein ACERII_01785 [Evansella sp. AB-rgal1]|uniref:hypothetical protein n=1 Tax=Evansella sp. AB-rgal1 TaxID=3242696 RepID=UPI00359D161A